MRLVWALVLASCCTPTKFKTAECVTPCGIHTPLDSNCGELVRFETLAIKRLGETEGLTASRICTSLKGWTLEVKQPEGVPGCRHGWHEASLCVLGFTHVRTHTISIVWPDTAPNVLAHEMVHVIDYAMRGYPGHCFWGARGVGQALLDITGQVDKSVDADCETQETLDGGL